MKDLEKVLEEIVEKNRRYCKEGKVADYIPELAKANPEHIAVAIADNDGHIYVAGDTDVKFCIESISKTVVLALALKDKGAERVFRDIGMEPTGDPFNSIIKLATTAGHKPYNPYINAGAIATTSLIKGATPEEKFERILQFTRQIAENQEIDLNYEVYMSEAATGNTNRSLAYFMKAGGFMEGEIEDILEVYFKQCSMNVTTVDLAKIALFFARGGVLSNGERVLEEEEAKIVKALMVTCGMYDSSGEYMVKVGIPSKSGVGGGIIGCIPGKYGICTFSPALDEKGNSVAGYHMMKDISKALKLSFLG
jgi:glutaminase